MTNREAPAIAAARVRLACRSRRAMRGVTMVELIFTIMLVAILASLAVPSFRDASLGSRLSSAANDLLSSVQLARSEAIKSNLVTILCTSTNGSTCDDDGDWEQGWIVLDGGGRVIDSHAALSTGFKLVEAGSNEEILFQPIGVGATAASFTACRKDPVGSQERVVTVTATGVAHVTRTTAGECPPD
jgi:type IV fimbrial biogenesis protein FimT